MWNYECLGTKGAYEPKIYIKLNLYILINDVKEFDCQAITK